MIVDGSPKEKGMVLGERDVTSRTQNHSALAIYGNTSSLNALVSGKVGSGVPCEINHSIHCCDSIATILDEAVGSLKLDRKGVGV